QERIGAHTSLELSRSSSTTSSLRYLRCPPRVRMYVSLPACAQRVTVFGSTWNIFATSAGVSSSVASSSPAEGFYVVASMERATYHRGVRGAEAPGAAYFRTGPRHRLIGRIGVLVDRHPCPATIPRFDHH